MFFEWIDWMNYCSLIVWSRKCERSQLWESLLLSLRCFLWLYQFAVSLQWFLSIPLFSLQSFITYLFRWMLKMFGLVRFFMHILMQRLSLALFTVEWFDQIKVLFFINIQHFRRYFSIFTKIMLVLKNKLACIFWRWIFLVSLFFEQLCQRFIVHIIMNAAWS